MNDIDLEYIRICSDSRSDVPETLSLTGPSHPPPPSYALILEAALKIQFFSNYFYVKVHHVDLINMVVDLINMVNFYVKVIPKKL